MWNTHRQQHIFFLVLIGIGAILSFFVFRPYILTLVLALILSIAIDPVYVILRRFFKGRARLSAVITILLIIALVIIPLSFFGYKIILEAQSVYTSVQTGSWSPQLLRNQLDESSGVIHAAWTRISQQLDSIAGKILNFFVDRVGTIFTSIASLVLNLFLLFISMYYILSRREDLYAFVRRISPLQDTYDVSIIKKLKAACNSVVRGTLAVALVQGIVASVGYTIFGVPEPMIWGGLTALAALVPTIGTTLVTAPAIVYLLAIGNFPAAVGMLIWAVIAIGLIDNFLGPLLIDRGTRLHPLIILLAILGGVSFLGAIGFIIGPVIVAFLVALVETYVAFSKKKDAS